MPIRLQPPDHSPIPTKDVTPPDLEAEGPAAEWFRIPAFFDEAANKAAREAATTRVQRGTKPLTEEFDQERYRRELISRNLSAWRLICPPGVPFDPERMEEADGNYFWQFRPETVAALPGDLAIWLAGEILSVSAVIPTESLLVETKSGKRVLDFRRPRPSLRTEQGLGDVDSLRGGAVPQGERGHRVARGR